MEEILFKDVKQRDVIRVTVHGETHDWKVMGWYKICEVDCLGLLRDGNAQLMLQEKFAKDLKLVSRFAK